MLADMPWYDYSGEAKNTDKESKSFDDFERPEDLRKYLESMNE